MAVNSSQLALDFRSIEADDIAGVQFLYGVKSPNKPQITTYELSGNSVTLIGTSFHATDNEVWFTHAQPTTGIDGTPVKLLGVRSQQNGTKIEVTIPAAAGPGDVLVKRRGDAFEDLSNAFPFDPHVPGARGLDLGAPDQHAISASTAPVSAPSDRADPPGLRARGARTRSDAPPR